MALGKTCRHCGVMMLASAFPPGKCRDGLSSWCRACHNEASKRSYREHPVVQSTVKKVARTPRARFVRPKVVTTCSQCGSEFTPPRKDSTVCSKTCQARRRGRPPQPSVARRVEATCAQCDATFTGSPGRRFCGLQCGRIFHRRIDRDRRRSLRNLPRADRLLRRTVFERDGWTCQLCHEAVDRTLPATHPDGATLDHIVPLKLGGQHAYANVQLAHRACNIRKGARLVAA